MSEMMEFDITVQEVTVKIGSDHYILREASGDSATKWQNKMFSSTKLGDNGKPTSVGNVADVEPYLLSMCIFPVTQHGTPDEKVGDRPVPEPIIRQWPARVVSSLYEKLLHISGLKKEKTRADITKEIAELQKTLTELGTSEEATPKI